MEQIFKLGSASTATKAKRLLSKEGIHGRIMKTEDTKDGCAWGVAVGGQAAKTASQLLRQAGIRYEAL